MASVTGLIGKVFDGRYQIVDLNGKGGMGAVYKAIHLAMNQTVALKVLNPEALGDDTAVQRFYHEAKASSRLKHPNTIKVFDFGRSEEGHLYLVMEYLEGQTLGALLREERVLSVGRSIKITKQVLKSLGEAHDQGLVHRDLKPDNIFLTKVFGENDFVKVLDFGISKFVDTSPDHETLTQAGLIPGTPLYVSPEQALGRSVGGTADIYSLGIILYQMVTGRPPFKADSAVALVMKQIHDIPPDPTTFNPNVVIPERLKKLIFAMLEKVPENRPAKALDVYQELEEIEKEGGYPDTPSKDLIIPGNDGNADNLIPNSTEITGQKALSPDEHESPTQYIPEAENETAEAKTQYIQEPAEKKADLPERPTTAITSPFTDEDDATILDDSISRHIAQSQSKNKPKVFIALLIVAILLGGGLYWALSGPEVPKIAKGPVEQSKPIVNQNQHSTITPKTTTKPHTRIKTSTAIPKTRRSSTPIPPEDHKKLKETHKIKIVTTPPNAMVQINGNTAGHTPLTYKLSTKAKVLSVHVSLKGYQPLTRKVIITNTPEQNISFILHKVQKPIQKSAKKTIKASTTKKKPRRKRPIKRKKTRKKPKLDWDEE